MWVEAWPLPQFSRSQTWKVDQQAGFEVERCAIYLNATPEFGQSVSIRGRYLGRKQA